MEGCARRAAWAQAVPIWFNEDALHYNIYKIRERHLLIGSLRIAHKLWLLVLAIVVMLVAVVAFAGYRSAKVTAESDVATVAMAARVEAAIRWAGLTETNAARAHAMVVSTEPAVEAAFKDAMVQTSAQVAKIAAARKDMASARAQAFQLEKDGQHDAAVAFVEKTYLPASAGYLQPLRDFVKM